MQDTESQYLHQYFTKLQDGEMWLKVAFSIIAPTLTQPLPLNADGVIIIHCHQLMEESLL